MNSKGLNRLYTVMYTLLTLAFMTTAWLLISTELILRPVAIHYSDRSVTLVRKTPFGEVWVEWSTEIRVAQTGLECSSGTNKSTYQVAPNNTVRYDLGAWADACLLAGPPLVIVDTWQAMVFGLIPLRPTNITTVIEVSKGVQDGTGP